MRERAPKVLLFVSWAAFLTGCAVQEAKVGTTAGPSATVDPSLSITQLIMMITAIGALGGAAFSLVDATKAFWGGVSNVGMSGLCRALSPFAPALAAALGQSSAATWQQVVRAHWINGRPRDEQKAIVKSLIRLGLSPETAGSLERAAHVREGALVTVAAKLEGGSELTDADVNVLGRLDASIEAQLDAAYDRADQSYRNVSRALAGLVAIGLAFAAETVLQRPDKWMESLLVGLIAVPLAPIAKDLASALQSAVAATRSVK